VSAARTRKSGGACGGFWLVVWGLFAVVFRGGTFSAARRSRARLRAHCSVVALTALASLYPTSRRRDTGQRRFETPSSIHNCCHPERTQQPCHPERRPNNLVIPSEARDLLFSPAAGHFWPGKLSRSAAFFCCR